MTSTAWSGRSPSFLPALGAAPQPGAEQVSLPRATAIAPSGTPAATATLAYDDRHRRRLRLTTDTGEPFLLDLPEAQVLRDGDLLALDDGRLILVRAAPEAVLDIRPPTPWPWPASPGTSATATPRPRSCPAACASAPTTCSSTC